MLVVAFIAVVTIAVFVPLKLPSYILHLLFSKDERLTCKIMARLYETLVCNSINWVVFLYV
jgi:hypothetical protein